MLRKHRVNFKKQSGETDSLVFEGLLSVSHSVLCHILLVLSEA